MPSGNRFSQVIVVGGTGQTGHRLLETYVKSMLTGEGQPIQIVATSRHVENKLPAGPLAVATTQVTQDALAWSRYVQWFPLDLEAAASVLFAQLEALSSVLYYDRPTVLVFAAAFTNVDGCETDPAYCKRVNETNTVEVLRWASSRHGAKIAFYSTDYVFDGVDGPYSEDAPRNPVQVYGRAKVFAEEWLERHAPDALILRTTGVYDYLPGSKNFLMQMLELWGQGRVTRIPVDQEANPIWAFDLARATIELLEKDASGIFNVAGGTQMARVEFAKLIAKEFNFDGSCIYSVRTVDLAQKAKRPLKGGLRCRKLQEILGWRPSPAHEVLIQLKTLHRSHKHVL